MVIGIDFDGTINNMLETWIEWLNKKYGTTVQMSDITDWTLSMQYPSLSVSELFEPLDTPEFWDEVTIKPDAPEVIQQLIRDGHEIYIVTSSHYKTLTYKFKRCLFKYFPFGIFINSVACIKSIIFFLAFKKCFF
jgi:5'(3')-deoxyribonucleotidase